MTTLARFARPGRDDLVAAQCDLCVPPVLSTSTLPEMRRLGWTLAEDGHPHDTCPWCGLSVAPRDRVVRSGSAAVVPDPDLLPNLVVVGAAKAGTTSLHTYLDLHPDIEMSQDKEMRFFTDPDCRGWVGRYQDYFTGTTRYRGESTPQYTKWPLFPGVVDRMADLVPDARLVYLVRDPVERAIAEYVEEVTWGVITEDFDTEVADAEAAYHRLVAPSRYATQLRELRRRFAPEQILVVDLADLGERRAETLGTIFDFLDLPRPALGEDDLAARNVWGDKGVHPRWYAALRRPWLVRAVHRLPTGQVARLRGFVSRRIATPVERPRPSEESLARLRAVLAPEAAELRELTGQRFADWSV
ncbi:sulfotransferase [Nocardioides panacisoli]|uniref:sulfotransferase family protein n=1 Tax=Nocardioides panacisoli TaxID=627624 RepID=UPI001C631D0B|nr:sulfotransferase [Nocardioides panacisoli]QYJ03928.1 sulfotransferase [Nocardioides panacisoli]